MAGGMIGGTMSLLDRTIRGGTSPRVILDRNHGVHFKVMSRVSLAQVVKEGGLDNTVSETVNVVASKTTEIGQRTWGIMKGVMAIASQKVEEFTKEEASNWNQQNKSGFYDDKAATNSSSSYQSNYRNSSSCDDWGEESNSKKEAAPKVSQSVHHNGYGNSNSWDDWGEEKNSTTKKEAAPKVSASKDDDAGWAGWDDKEDDGYYQSAAGDKKSVGHNGKPPEPA
ncbi:unnamed protein product [Brassica oleracea var. botrytis]|uniref:(rape) hypothetical protein n=1 Tax=Brassica napus TaxID=3708 RepID=A0A816QR98_BRANA|nr:unnamed protein product [Brassica napus]